MIEQISLRGLIDQMELIPQAIVREQVQAVARRCNLDYERGRDDLDQYEGIGIILDDQLRVALMHYRGHPDNTATIYLPDAIRDVGLITDLIKRIAGELRIPDSSITWQRKDDPSL